jgi:hypothetical protein
MLRMITELWKFRRDLDRFSDLASHLGHSSFARENSQGVSETRDDSPHVAVIDLPC